MANFKAVNKSLKAAYPLLDIEVVRGKGYVYFDGKDAFGKIESICCHPTSTSTEKLIHLAIQSVQIFFDFYPSGDFE
tara:strand:- start:521 stop:751 length:231 start_codon:yes stop_codon:yes gene_type:complete